MTDLRALDDAALATEARTAQAALDHARQWVAEVDAERCRRGLDEATLARVREARRAAWVAG